MCFLENFPRIYKFSEILTILVHFARENFKKTQICTLKLIISETDENVASHKDIDSLKTHYFQQNFQKKFELISEKVELISEKVRTKLSNISKNLEIIQLNYYGNALFWGTGTENSL